MTDAELLGLCDTWTILVDTDDGTVHAPAPELAPILHAARESVALRAAMDRANAQNDMNAKARALLARDIAGLAEGKPPVTANGHAVWLVIEALRADVARLASESVALRRENERLRHPKPLTQEEVNALPAGARVVVTWSGGNGPHEYTIGVRDGRRYALCRWDEEDPERPWSSDAELTFVGPSRPHTVVTVAPESLVALRADVARLREALAAARRSSGYAWSILGENRGGHADAARMHAHIDEALAATETKETR